MSFLQQLDGGETPALTLEETLAFLDSFDDSDFSSSCPSTTSSPPYDGDVDDDMDDVLNGGGGGADSSATTAVGGSSGSECLWSDSDDGLGCVMPAAKTDHGGATQAKTTVVPPAAPSRIIAPPQSKPRQKRKAASASASTHTSPRGGLMPDKADAFDDADSTTATPGKRRTRKQPKTEILRLRDQVEELQARLMQLQKAGGGPNSQLVSARNNSARATGSQADKSSTLAVRAPNSQNASMWLDHAVDQYKALQKSEALNEKLKAEVKRQSSLGKMLKTLFKKKTAQQVCGGLVLMLVTPF